MTVGVDSGQMVLGDLAFFSKIPEKKGSFLELTENGRKGSDYALRPLDAAAYTQHPRGNDEPPEGTRYHVVSHSGIERQKIGAAGKPCLDRRRPTESCSCHRIPCIANHTR